MGFFNRSRNVETNVPADPASTLGRADALPAESGTLGNIKARGNAIAGKASQIYKRNPKLLGGLALIAGAVVLNRMKRPH
jgi:hypothetical protein